MKSKRIKQKALIFAVIFAMMAFVSGESTSATTVLVPDDYATIQEAVDAANAGDTIIVRDGTYRENIDVKKRLTLKSEKGSENCNVQAAAPDDHVFNVSADHVEISGFSVEGANDYKKAGIGLHADYCNISNNTCSSNNEYGIYLEWPDNNFIYLNNFINNCKGVYYTVSENIWNSTEKITYTYNGSTYSNSLGNYWADYTGNDANDDEIGETPYRIKSDEDNYPLMLPWQNYIPEETRAAENKKKALSKE